MQTKNRQKQGKTFVASWRTKVGPVVARSDESVGRGRTAPTIERMAEAPAGLRSPAL